MIYIIQSYSAPGSIEQSQIFQIVNAHFHGQVKAVPKITPYVKNFTVTDYFKAGVKSYNNVTSGDVLFGWGGDLCLFAWLRSLFGFKKLLFLNQNLIVNPELTNSHQIIRRLLYRLAFRSKRFFVTVNSPDLIDFYSKMFHCDKSKFIVVYDSMSVDESEVASLDKDNQNPYVFFGGKQDRDIDTFLNVVKRNPNIKFKAVILKNDIKDEMAEIPNLEVFHDVPKEKFFEILDNATACCIPLKAKSPCGVSVMQHAILCDIPIVSTDTPSMRAIVPSDSYGFLLPRGDAEGMSEKLKMVMLDSSLRETITQNAKANMDHMTPHAVGLQICDALDKVISNKT